MCVCVCVAIIRNCTKVIKNTVFPLVCVECTSNWPGKQKKPKLVKTASNGLCVFITAGPCACVCLLLQDLLQSCARGGGG